MTKTKPRPTAELGTDPMSPRRAAAPAAAAVETDPMERIAVAAEMMAMEAQKFNSCLATFAMQSARQGKRVIKLLDEVIERTTTLTKMGSLTGLPKTEETLWRRLSPTESYAPRNYDFQSTDDLLVVAHWPLAFHVTGAS